MAKRMPRAVGAFLNYPAFLLSSREVNRKRPTETEMFDAFLIGAAFSSLEE